MSARPAPARVRRDHGFTLPELLIAVVVTGIIIPVIGFAIAVSLRTLPDTAARADAGVAIQGIATWLPADVDSTEPGGIDADPSRVSGCKGTDPGRNLVRLTWKETFRGVTVVYVAAYRFVVTGTSAHIVRLSCSGTTALGPAARLSMSGRLARTPPGITVLDDDGDGLSDRVRLSVTTLAGPMVFIDAVSKNPSETLPPPPPLVTTTTTTVPNQAPVAAPVALTANPSVAVTIVLPVFDPDGDPLSVTLAGVPAGWVVATNGTTLTITPTLPTGTSTITYTVRDTAGLTTSATISITVVTTATTTSSTTTTTTTPPPCVLSNMSASPSTVALTAKGSGKLKRNVRVTISIASGYCVGLTLHYETGAPNGQYVQNFGNMPPYAVTLLGHPMGTELWAVGPRELVVRDGTGAVLGSRVLTVTD